MVVWLVMQAQKLFHEMLTKFRASNFAIKIMKNKINLPPRLLVVALLG